MDTTDSTGRALLADVVAYAWAASNSRGLNSQERAACKWVWPQKKSLSLGTVKQELVESRGLRFKQITPAVGFGQVFQFGPQFLGIGGG